MGFGWAELVFLKEFWVAMVIGLDILVYMQSGLQKCQLVPSLIGKLLLESIFALRILMISAYFCEAGLQTYGAGSEPSQILKTSIDS